MEGYEAFFVIYDGHVNDGSGAEVPRRTHTGSPVSEKNPSRNCPKSDSSNAPTVIWPLYGGQKRAQTKVLRFICLQGYVAGTL